MVNAPHRHLDSRTVYWKGPRSVRSCLLKQGAPLVLVLLLFLIATSLGLFPRILHDDIQQTYIDPWSTVPSPPYLPYTLKGKQRLASKHPQSRLIAAQSLITQFTVPEYRPACALSENIDPRYKILSAANANSTIYLSLNLFDAQAILPNFIHELANLISYMGAHRFYLSIIENGSADLTPGLLLILSRALEELGSSYEIVIKGDDLNPKKDHSRRIMELATARNSVLESLYNGSAAQRLGIRQFDTVLFMEEIFWCASDILEILYEHFNQGADMTCATDWGSEIVYDRWVARTIAGLPLYRQSDLVEYFNGANPRRPPIPRPLPDDERSRNYFIALGPMQVFSCWNGAVALKAEAFVSSNPSSTLPVRFRTAQNDVSEITNKASECFLLCVDLWKRGMGRILLVPKASVAYDLQEYQRVRQDGGRTVPHPAGIEPPSSGYRNTIVHWQSAPPPAVIYHDYAWWHEKERWGPWDEA